MRALASGVLAAAAWLGGGCRGEPFTELVVVVTSDMEPGTVLRQVRVQVAREGQSTPLHDRTYPILTARESASGAQGFTLPGEVAVFASDPDDARRFTVDVSADLPETEGDFTIRAVVRPALRHVVFLEMFLPDRCHFVFNRAVCPEGTVCGRTGCEPIERGTTPAPPDTGSPAIEDASALDDLTDACPGASEVCSNGVDDDCDGLTDEGCPSRSCGPEGIDPSTTPSDARPCGELTFAPTEPFDLGDPSTKSGLTVNAQPLQSGVRLSPFRMDQSEVSVGRFRAFWRAGHPAPPRGRVRYPGGEVSLEAIAPSWTSWPVSEPVMLLPNQDGGLHPLCAWTRPQTPDYEALPLNCVSWFTAMAFCVWDGGRLPTEAEWEYAARWRPVRDPSTGAELPLGRRYPWGNEVRHCGANYQDATCLAMRAPRGQWHVGYTLAPSWWGLYDLAGNAAEWTADALLPFGVSPCWPSRSLQDPLCALPGSTLFVTRGGSTNSAEDEVRGAARLGLEALRANINHGFRCVRTP